MTTTIALSPVPAAPAAGAPPPAVKPAPVDRRQRLVDATLRRHQYRQDALIEALHTAQSAYGYLTPEMLWYIADQLHLPPSKVYGVATFYNFFTLKPAGLHTIVVCQGTACYIRGGPKLAAALQDAFGIASGETTPDGMLSVVTARCLGSCGLAPAAILDGTVLSRLTPESLVSQVRQAITRGSGSPAPPAATAEPAPSTGGES